MYLKIHPTKSDLEYLESWLQEEYQTFGEGLYSNWNLILESYEEGQLAVFKKHNSAIGFVSWHDGEIQRNINLMAVQPRFRKMGLGRTFCQEFEEFTRSQGFAVILLFCSPEGSQYFWRKIGFLDVHKASLIYHPLSLYKPLIDRLESTESTPLNRIELWDDEPIKIKKDTPPKWVWDLSDISPSKPILEASSYEWNLKITLEGQKAQEGKIKYFRELKIHSGSFLYISNIDDLRGFTDFEA